jgi:dephospho-CoA kinase
MTLESKMAKLILGLTGSIATGKSTVGKMLEELGAVHIDADKVAHETYAPGGPAYVPLVQHFGNCILAPDGTIDRQKLGKRVFGPECEADRRRLESITWPAVNAALADRLMQVHGGVVVIEAAKLIEAKLAGAPLPTDYTVLVTADEMVQVGRLMQRNGLTEAEAYARVRSQRPQAEKAKHAHYVIDNSGTLDQTRAYVRFLWENEFRPKLG